MPAAAVAAAATVGSALISSSAAKKAAKTQAASADRAAQVQWDMFNQSRTDATPWRDAGGKAITGAFAMTQPGYNHTTSPGYQFRMDEGMRAIENSGAARGLLGSGGTLKDIIRFSQGTAANDFNDQFNRLSSIAAGGQQVNSNLANVGQNAATNAGNAYMQAANARASGYAGQAGAIGGALNNIAFMGMNGMFGGGGSNLSSLVPSVNQAMAQNPGLF